MTTAIRDTPEVGNVVRVRDRLWVVSDVTRSELATGTLVIGFDDIDAAAWLQPALSTVRQETRMMGRLAAERLIERIRASDTEGHPPPVRLPMVLCVRESTAAPPV